MKRICVFCGSNPGVRPEYAAAARAMGLELAGRGISLVYGGGRTGLMGTLADTMLGAGGEVIGVMPEALVAKEVAHRELSELRIVGSMHERKALMAELADGFIALPGGFGTFEEFCEILTWTQLGFQRKPCGVLNVAGFYDSLLGLFDHAVGEGFVKRHHREIVVADTDTARLVTRLFERLGVPAGPDKWPERVL